MKIFPIGTVTANSSTGTIDSVSYDFFEPNKGCKSNEVHSILTSKFENQTRLTRKKAEPFKTFAYQYNNIFDREFRQIEHFVYSMSDSLTSFRLVDLSKGQTPSAVASIGGDWYTSIDNTRLFSTVTNQKADRAFFWDGLNWRDGAVTSITTNASVVINVDASKFGGLAVANASVDSIIYPSYMVYSAENSLGAFKTTHFVGQTMNTGADGGWMRSGALSFVSKYKV